VVCVDWKVARGFPLFKGKGKDPSNPDSYRLISLTSIIARVFERCIFRRIYSFLENNSFFNPLQFGFRAHRSTYDPLLILTHFIRAARNHRSFLPVAFLDIKKAFDSVWHEGLLFKLFRAGVKGRSWRWIADFLRGRKFSIVHSGASSDWYDVTASVPQGSVLAALLFIIFINDLPSSCSRCFAPLFADDVALWPSNFGDAGVPDLNTSLTDLSKWASMWRLHFANKSTVVVFCFKRRPPSLPPFILESFSLPVETTYPYMGALLHQSLSWTPLFTALRRKLASTSFAISHLISRDRPPSAGLVGELVRCILLPRLAYALPFWEPTDRQFRSLQSIIVRPLRHALGLPRHTHYISILSEFGIPSIRCYRQYLLLKAATRFLSLSRSNIAGDVFVHNLITSDESLPWPPSSLNSRHPQRVALRAWYHHLFSALDPLHARTATALDSQLSRLTTISSSIPLARDVRMVAASWGLPLLRSVIQPRLSSSHTLSRSLHEWDESGHGRHLLQFHQSFLHSSAPRHHRSQSYLWLDERRDQITRARFRFDALPLNRFLFQRLQIPSANCEHCEATLGVHVEESVSHILLECTKYDRDRSEFLSVVHRITPRAPLSLPVILDPLYQPTTAARRGELLSASAKFLRSVLESRNL
jgi:hypothetical protein